MQSRHVGALLGSLPSDLAQKVLCELSHPRDLGWLLDTPYGNALVHRAMKTYTLGDVAASWCEARCWTNVRRYLWRVMNIPLYIFEEFPGTVPRPLKRTRKVEMPRTALDVEVVGAHRGLPKTLHVHVRPEPSAELAFLPQTLPSILLAHPDVGEALVHIDGKSDAERVVRFLTRTYKLLKNEEIPVVVYVHDPGELGIYALRNVVYEWCKSRGVEVRSR